MKPVRNILILAGVIILLVGGVYAVNRYQPKQEDKAAATMAPTVSIFKTDKDNITTLAVTTPEEGTYALTKEGEVWIVNNDPSIRISQSRVDTLLYECASITGRDKLAENVQDLSQYGLDQPQRVVKITLSDGRTTTVLIGNVALENSVAYLMLEGENTVYTKSASGCDSLAMPLSKLLDTSVYTIDSEDIGGITLEKPGAEPVRLIRENTAAPDAEEPAYVWKMEAPLQKEASDYMIGEKLLKNIVTQTAVQVISDPAADSAYGLDQPQAVYSIWNLDNSKHYTVQVGKAEGENTYIRLVGQKTVYTVATENLDFLSLGYMDLADKLIHLENITEVSEIDIDAKGKQYHLTISGADDNAVYTINDKKVEESKFKKAYQTIIGLVMDEFVTDSNKGAVACTVRYTKKDGSQTVVECVEYNDRNYRVLVNGEGNLLIRKKQVDTMLAQLDKTIAE